MFCTVQIYCQKISHANEFLSKIGNDESVKFQKQKIQHLEYLPYKLPRIDKLEFRTETNGFNLLRQDYVLRISPNSLNNIRTHSQYHQTVKNLTQREMEESIAAALKSRYDLIVDRVYLEEILNVRKKLQVLYKDKIKLFTKSISLAGFDVLDLIDAEDELQFNSREILDLENKLLSNHRVVQRMNEKTEVLYFDKKNLISIDDLIERVNEIESKDNIEHSSLSVQSAKLYNSILVYEWESAKSKFSISYIQAKYGYKPEEGLRETFSLGFGFEIPLRHSASLDLNEMLIDKLAAESNYKKIKKEIEDNKFILAQQLENSIKKYKLVNKQLEDGQAEFVIDRYSRLAEASVIAILTLRENTLKNELLKIKLEWEIMQTFISFLDQKGILSKKPLRNYLSKNQDFFKLL